MNRFVTAALTAMVLAAPAGQAMSETLKIAFIDPLSGPFGGTGDAGLRHWQYAADLVNADDGVNGNQVEVIGFDNKINPKESLIQLQKAIDQGVRYIAQGNGSSVASALIDAIDKHNKRNPGEEVLFLNYAAVDPVFTNDRCSFWHFRFDSDADMKMEAVTDWINTKPEIKKVYIIGQDYSFGKAVAAAAVKMIGEKRPDIEIVGNELHPLGKVKDFTPYIQKMISSGADAVITGNWGADMVLLVKAATSSGHDVPYLTYYAGGLGAAAAMGEGAVGRVLTVSEVNTNLDTPGAQDELIDGFEDKYTDISYYYQRVFNAMNMLDAAATKANSIDPTKVAMALEGMEYETPYGTVTMRADNHQILQSLYMSTFSKDVKRDVEKTGLGWVSGEGDKIAAADTAMETSCKMTRP